MTNKEILQENNNIIDENNADLENVIEIVDNLPTIKEYTIEKWIFTMEDNSTITKNVVIE